jgi:integrase/recombinase XerD
MADRHLVEAYLESLGVERGAADNTLAAYARDLDDYLALLAGRCRRCSTPTRSIACSRLRTPP